MVAAILFALMFQAQDPVRVRAQLTQTEVRVGETTTLRVEVETDGPRAQIQRIASLPPGMELTGTRDYDQRQFTLPGGGRRFISRDHALRVRSPGRYEVPAVEVVVDGRVYTTRPLILTVSGAGPAALPDGSPVGPGGVVLRAWLDADTVFVGQQVTLHVETVFSQEARLRLRRAPEYEPPSPSGFWVQDVPGDRAPATRGTRGDVYETQTFRRVLFPIAPGRYEIPPARLFYEMRRAILQAPETFVIASDPLPIVVLPAPDEGRPPGYTGAVGQLTLRGWLEPDRIPAGEAAVITVEVRGTGNIKALPPPTMPEIAMAEVFPPTEESMVEVGGEGVQGWKRFSWVVIPRRPGELMTPEIAYPVFDPATREYHTLTASLPPIQVTPGGPVAAAGAPAGVRYLKTTPDSGSRIGWVRSPWFAVAQLVPLLLVAGAAVRRNGGRGPRPPSSRALSARRRAGIRELESGARAGAKDFLARADGFALRWVADRLGIEARLAGNPEALAAAGVSQDTARRFRQAMDRIAAARFAPQAPDPETRLGLVRSLDRVLELIDREGRRSRAAGMGGPVAGAVLAGLVLVGPAASQRVTGPDAAAFQAGIGHFDAGRYGDAARAFREHLEHVPGDAAGWYNLGTSHFRAGESGPALWAWLNALCLRPRDRDTRHNLRVVGAAPELVGRVSPPLRLSVEELLLGAALAWFLVGVAAAWWIVRRRVTHGVLAGCALVLAVALGIAAAGSATAAPTLVALGPTVLRAGPHLQAEPVASMAAGAGLVSVDEQGAWVRARTLGGIEGWVEADVVGLVPGP
jgi:hypothetical protein